MDQLEIQKIAQEVRPIVYQAGQIALKHFRRVSIELKADQSYVTDADREVEHFIREELTRRYPEHGFFGEETGHRQSDDAECIWALDPIDGTAPFIFELPLWAVSLGLISREKLLIGFTYIPVLDDLYWAVDGGPAYRNGNVIRVCEPVEPGKESTIVLPSKILHEYRIQYRGRALAFGSAAANICIVANGKLHGGFQERIRLYDICASSMVLQQAGGVMRYLSGKEVNLWDLRDGRRTPEAYIFGHPKMVERLLPLFEKKKEVED